MNQMWTKVDKGTEGSTVSRRPHS